LNSGKEAGKRLNAAMLMTENMAMLMTKKEHLTIVFIVCVNFDSNLPMIMPAAAGIIDMFKRKPP
jgi:hypothetical protein